MRRKEASKMLRPLSRWKPSKREEGDVEKEESPTSSRSLAHIDDKKAQNGREPFLSRPMGNHEKEKAGGDGNFLNVAKKDWRRECGSQPKVPTLLQGIQSLHLRGLPHAKKR